MEQNCDCCWIELLRSHRPTIRLFTCLRAWRYVTLQHKHRRCIITPKEWEQTRFFEMELPLHAVVTALNHFDETLDEPFEILGSCYALYPNSAMMLDHQRRPPLYYALELRWGLEKLSWLVDKSLEIVLEKDADKLSLVVHAIMNECPEELIIRLAVAASSRCIHTVNELLNDGHFENARRFCHLALQDFFAGVPKFPHAQCRIILGGSIQNDDGQARIIAITIRDIWTGFIDTWGHFGAPLLQRDIPEVLSPVIDSFVEVAIVAKGEPLTYQWIYQQNDQDEGTPIEGATQSFIFISPSIQPHNEGIYYCEVINRRGRVVSTRMKVFVVDDRAPPDPTKNFVVGKELLTAGANTLRCFKACVSGRLQHSKTEATIVFQPYFFKCLDGDGNDVSDTHGAEIAIMHRVVDETKLVLHSNEKLVSCLIEILPASMGNLLRPALLWLPHCLVPDENNCIVVVEIDMKCRRVLREIRHAYISDKFIRVAINRLGTFTVISRRKRMGNDGDSSDAVLERARLLILRPKTVSASSVSGTVNVLLTLVHDLPNCCSEAEHKLRELAGDVNDSSRVINSFEVNIKENFSLILQIGGGGRVVFRYPSRSGDVLVTNVEISLASLTSSVGGDYSAFLNLTIHAAVSKTPAQTHTRMNSFMTRNLETLSNSDSILFERDWTIVIQVLHDAQVIFKMPPPTPSIIERTNTHLVLKLDGEICCTDRENTSDSPTELKPLLSPYFYVVEMAIFSPTFWHRYDRTWWFDKTKTNVIEGMYKVVHRGFNREVSISTSAYAGCVRVAFCSIDRFGDFSEPLLLTPLIDTGVSDPLSDTKLTSIVNSSPEMEETAARLQQLFDTLHIDNGTLSKVYGLPNTSSAADVVAVLLESKTSLRAWNFELTLLLSGFKTLERQLERVKVASGSYKKFVERFLQLQRAIPELEHSPGANFLIIRQLHEILRDASEVVTKLSSPGWLQYFLLDEWFENALSNIFQRTVTLLASDASNLQCGRDIRVDQEAPKDNSIPWVMKTARSSMLLIVGRLQEVTDRETKLIICRELCHTLRLYPESDFQLQTDDQESVKDAIIEKFLVEFESPTSQQALIVLRKQDSFVNHLVCVTPCDGEKCDHIPEAVHFDLDPFIRGVNQSGMHLVIRVANVSLDSCVVQGKSTFCERTARLSFIPAAEFEAKSRYCVTVREHEIQSSLGGNLPERPPFTIHFLTP